jgi:tape measure domain-containing protein
VADVSIGNITASLTLNAQQFQQGMQQALATLQQFQAAAQRQGGGSAQLTLNTTQFQQGMAAALQSLQQFQAAMQQQAGGAAPQAFTRTAQAVQALTQQLTLLNQQAVAQTAALGQLAAGLGRLENALQSLGTAARAGTGHVQNFGSAWQNMLQIAGGIGIATSIQGLTRVLMDFAEETVKVGVRMENLRASFGALAGSVPAGQQNFQRLFETAQRMGVAFEPLAQGFRQLTAAATQAKVPLADQFRLLEAVTNEGRRTGASSDQVGRAITALAQMASKGKVSMEELRQQLGEAMPTALAALALGMGRSIEEVEKMIAAGLRAPQAFQALIRGWEEMQRGSGAMAETSGQAFAKLGNAWLHLQDTIMQSGLNTYLVTVAKNLQNAVEWADKFMGGKPGPATVGGTGPVLGPAQPELGVPAIQQTERIALEARLKELQRPLIGGVSPQLQAEIDRTKEELALLDQRIRKTADTAIEEQKVQAATAKTTADLGLQRDHWIAIADKMAEIRKAREELRKEAAVAPEVFGRPGGNPEERARFLAEERQRITPLQESLGTLLAKPPAGMVIGPEILGQAKELGVEFENISKQKRVLEDTLQLAGRRRDTLAQEVQSLEQITVKRQAELIAIKDGQQAAEEFTRTETTRLAQARLAAEARLVGMRPDERIQAQIADYEKRLAGLRQQASQLGAEVEQQRVQAMRPQMEAELARIQTLMGRAGQPLAEQAAADAQQRVLQLRPGIEKMLREIGQHPGLQDLREQLQTALAGLGDAAGEQAKIAYDKVNTHLLNQVAGIGDQVGQIGRQIAEGSLTPLEAALLRVNQHFEGMTNQLMRFQRDLAEKAVGATPEAQVAIAARQQAIEQYLASMNAAREQALAMVRLQEQLVDLEREKARSARDYETLQRQRQSLERLQYQPAGPFGIGRQPTPEERQERALLTTDEARAQYDAQYQQIVRQERLNYTAQVFEQFAGSVGSAWTNALTSIANGTATVSEAFRQMAQSIIQSMAQIAAQEAFRGIMRLGVGLITGSLTGAVTPAASGTGMGPDVSGTGGMYGDTSWMAAAFGGGGGGGGGGGFGGFQHGGVVRRPTMAMIGENPANNPEFIFNRHQMDRMMSSAMSRGPSAGGQAAGVTIINVATEGQAEQERLKREGLGYSVVINHVLKELSSGESSKINRAMRNLSR